MMEMKYMEDCIHLHACRRLQRLIESRGFTKTGRRCDEDCTAYQSGESGVFLTPEQAVQVAWNGVSMIESGYGRRDAYTSDDFEYAGTKGVFIPEEENDD